MKIVTEIVDDCMRSIERIIRNEVPAETCAAKKEKAEWKKEQIRLQLIERLHSTQHPVGPTHTPVEAGPSILK